MEYLEHADGQLSLHVYLLNQNQHCFHLFDLELIGIDQNLLDLCQHFQIC